MARPLRITYPGAFYHITSRGNERRAIFKNERDREKFLEYLESATDRYRALIHAFCLMGNHYHLLLETPKGNLPQIMRHINGAYTAYFNAKWSRSGHLFQGRYKAILVEKDEYAKELSRYIHLNPVRAKMVKSPEAYPWSSYIHYIGREKAPQWLNREFILGYMGKKTTLAQKRYQQFVLSLVDQAYDSPLREATGSVLLGTQDFIESIQSGHLFDESPSRDLPAIRQLLPYISIERVVETVEEIFENDRSLARNVSIYLCRKHTGEKLKTIGQQFGISDAAVSQVCKRLPTRIANDMTLKDRLKRVEKKLKMSNVET